MAEQAYPLLDRIRAYAPDRDREPRASEAYLNRVLEARPASRRHVPSEADLRIIESAREYPRTYPDMSKVIAGITRRSETT